MQDVEFDTTIDIDGMDHEFHVIAEFSPCIPQGLDGDGGRVESVKIISLTDEFDEDWFSELSDIEREILKAEVSEHV